MARGPVRGEDIAQRLFPGSLRHLLLIVSLRPYQLHLDPSREVVKNSGL